MTEMDAFIARMPDIVKLTIVGVGMDPPTIDPATVTPSLSEVLEHFVQIGIAVSSVSGDLRSYHLTVLGREVFHRIQHQQPSDGTLTANDDYPDNDPEAA